MPIFRTHIIRWTVSFMLILGIASHAAIPYSSQAQKTAFTQWLDRNVAESGNESEVSIRDHIRQLPVLYENFPLLLKQASMLVANHKSDFNLPLGQDRSDTGMISLWLVEKWSQHQSESGNMDALLPEFVKSGLKWIVQNQTFPGLQAFSFVRYSPPFSEVLNGAIYIVQNQPIPFLSGISINAP